jgi:hypothetical protein
VKLELVVTSPRFVVPTVKLPRDVAAESLSSVFFVCTSHEKVVKAPDLFRYWITALKTSPCRENQGQ